MCDSRALRDSPPRHICSLGDDSAGSTDQHEEAGVFNTPPRAVSYSLVLGPDGNEVEASRYLP
jgi:hypothetical protein